jgi:Protein of unknown function (DUF3040)
MLSEHERRELALIEQELGQDQGLVASFHARKASRRDRWLVRGLIAVGILLVVTGVAAGVGGLVLQGLLAVGTGVGWSRWRAWRAAGKPPGADRPEHP